MNSIPIELLNEPFSFSDNCYRPEVIVPRERFHFEVTQHCSRVFIQDREVITCNRLSSSYSRLEKRGTNVSILTVYDTYGLDIALKFLAHISRQYAVDTDQSILLYTYLRGCERALGAKNYIDRDYIQAGGWRASILESVVDGIAARLRLLDKKQPKAMDTEQEVSCHMPIELVATMTQSLRISKAVSRLVIEQREIEIVPIEHLRGWYDREGIIRTDQSGTWIIDGRLSRYEVRMLQDGKYAVAGPITGYSLLTSESNNPVASLQCYISYFASRRCDVKRSVSVLLDRLRDEAPRMSVQTVINWTCRLLSDTITEIACNNVNEDELRSSLLRLIERARE
ncbi:Hypothetical protein POVR2_LOCUS206 [uncultured virus]|nr:Hypothetical protein POVR2_LOCUS206 [uncultured virus]